MTVMRATRSRQYKPRFSVSVVFLIVKIAMFVVPIIFVAFSVNEVLSQSTIERDHQMMAENAQLITESLLPKRRRLPSFDEGGVVIFFHIAKTGGISIRDHFKKVKGVKAQRIFNPSSAIGIGSEIEKRLSSNNSNKRKSKGILFVEIHGDVPGLVHWKNKLQLYRRLAQKKVQSQQNVESYSSPPIFVFTILREPISFHLSYLNFFRVAPCPDSWCEPPLYDPPVQEQALVESAVPNHQCLWLARVSHHPNQQPTDVTTKECEETYRFLKENVDWVGTMEELSTVTFPLLSYMMDRSYNMSSFSSAKFKRQNVNDQKEGRLRYEDLSNQTIQLIRERSAGDFELYESVQRDYKIDRFFENYSV